MLSKAARMYRGQKMRYSIRCRRRTLARIAVAVSCAMKMLSRVVEAIMISERRCWVREEGEADDDDSDGLAFKGARHSTRHGTARATSTGPANVFNATSNGEYGR